MLILVVVCCNLANDISIFFFIGKISVKQELCYVTDDYLRAYAKLYMTFFLTLSRCKIIRCLQEACSSVTRQRVMESFWWNKTLRSELKGRQDVQVTAVYLPKPSTFIERLEKKYFTVGWVWRRLIAASSEFVISFSYQYNIRLFLASHFASCVLLYMCKLSFFFLLSRGAHNQCAVEWTPPSF